MKRFLVVITLFITVQFTKAQSANWQTDPHIKQLTIEAQTYEKSGDHIKAANSYLAIFNLDKNNYVAANSMAGILGVMKDYRTQQIWAQKAVNLKPNFADAYINLGTAYGGQQNYDKAILNFKEAIRFDPKNPYSQYSLATLEQQTGNLKEAVKYYEQALVLDENYDDTTYKLAVVYNDLKEYAKANDNIRKYLESFFNSEKAQQLHHCIMDSLKAAFSFPVMPQTGKTLNDYLAKGWKVRDKVIGDLNGDNLPDAAIVLEYYAAIEEQRETNFKNEGHPRILIIAFKTADGYKLALQHNTFILRDGEGGMSNDPYDKLEITKGVLNINFEFVRGYLNYKVRYQANNFYLIGATESGHDMSGYENWDFNFSTKKAEHAFGGSPENPQRDKTELKTIHTNTLKKLSDLSKPYSWEVFKDVFI